MAWRLAESLETLRAELDAAFPARSKASDGTLGDQAHAARASRHNANSAGVVCAMDITHDPAHGCDIHAIARRLVRTPHPNLEYVISNREVSSRQYGWMWRPYTGANPHEKHVHFAVGRGPDSEPTPPYDDTTPWGVAPQEDELMGAADEILQRIREIQATQEKHNTRFDVLETRIREIQATQEREIAKP